MRTIRYVRWLLVALLFLSFSGATFAQIGISISIGPPALPIYTQPVCPGDGYLWTPGYWAYDYDIGQYYWVPGTWVLAPEPGFLWTPPWWGWLNGAFFFHEGFWGPHIGFYGGINYGFGYFGTGFVGGRWDGGHFFYNRSVTNVNVTNIHNVYNTTVVNNNVTVNRVSYNGGNGGTTVRPTPEEEAAARDRHIGPVPAQTEHVNAARSNPQLRANVNHGAPPIAATPRPGAFNGRGVEKASAAGAPYRPEAEGRPGETAGGGRAENNVPRPPAHASEVQPHERPPAPNTGNAKLDQKYQKQQDQLYSKMEQEHQRLQQKQDQEHQKAEQQHASEAQRQQMEQRHQQQTAQMEQRHQQQIQHLQERQQPRSSGKPR